MDHLGLVKPLIVSASALAHLETMLQNAMQEILERALTSLHRRPRNMAALTQLSD